MTAFHAILAHAVAGATSGAAPVEPDAVPFAIGTPSGRFEVQSFPAPPARTLPRSDRICAVRLTWSGTALSAHDAGCPEAVAPEVLFTVEGWQVTGPPTPTDLGEVWFVYPTDRPWVPRVLVRQSSGRLLSLPAGVDPVPFVIRAWSFLRYPADAFRLGLPDVTCTVHIDADARGYPTRVDVEGCDAPFLEEAASAIRAWRFAPASVDGGDIGTGLTLRATFVAANPDREGDYVPSDESARMWAAGQFEAMNREDRVWFIQAALLGPEMPDLGPGQVKVTLPSAPDLGGRPAARFSQQAVRTQHVRPLPDHDPILRLGRAGFVEIRAYDLELPASPVAVEASCPVLVQVDGEGQVFSWAEASCDDEVRDLSLHTADAWLLRHDDTQNHATRHRFNATFQYSEAGTRLVLPGDLVRTERERLPQGVHTLLEPRPVFRPPPRIPNDQPMPDATCRIEVVVSDRGRPEELTVTGCPDEVAPIAERAVRRWRWAPAEEDGEPISAVTTVEIAFRP